MITSSQSSRTDEMAGRIYEKYSDTVFKIAYARTNSIYDAEDITQEVFFRYLRKKPLFESDEHEKAWFIRAAINCTKSLLTSAWFKKTRQLDLIKNAAAEMTEKSEVYYAVAKLPQQMRILVHLFYYEEYKVSEIALMTGKSESNVKTTLMRARKKLADALRTPEEREEFNDV